MIIQNDHVDGDNPVSSLVVKKSSTSLAKALSKLEDSPTEELEQNSLKLNSITSRTKREDLKKDLRHNIEKVL